MTETQEWQGLVQQDIGLKNDSVASSPEEDLLPWQNGELISY